MILSKNWQRLVLKEHKGNLILHIKILKEV